MGRQARQVDDSWPAGQLFIRSTSWHPNHKGDKETWHGAWTWATLQMPIKMRWEDKDWPCCHNPGHTRLINQQNLTNHTRICVVVIQAGRAHAWIGPLIEFTHYNKNKSTLQAGLCTLCSVCLVWEHHSAYHFLLATHFSCLHHPHAFSSSLVALTLQEMCPVKL